MEKEKLCVIQNKDNLLVEESKPEKVVKEENGKLPTRITENILEKEKMKNELLGKIEKTNLGIKEMKVFQLILQNLEDMVTFKHGRGSEDEGESKKKRNKKSIEISDLSVTEPEVKLNLCKMENNISFGTGIEIKQGIPDTKEERRKESKSYKNPLNEPEEIENCGYTPPHVKSKNSSSSDKLHNGIEEMLVSEKVMLTGSKHNYMMEEGVKENFNKSILTRLSDFAEMSLKGEELPSPILEKVIPVSNPDNHSCKKIGKRKTIWTSGIIQKKVRKGDQLSKMDEVKREKDDEELELSDYVEHDKKYFFVNSANIACKLCNFKGKLIVQHYRLSHPESEVLISRLNPEIAEILIEDAMRNCEEYDKDHPEFDKITSDFMCPFCLMLIKGTANMHYSHISSHTGECYFHCNNCTYSTYDHTNINSHLNQIHCKIQKTEYKMVYLDLKISKYIFGFICSECNFIQLMQTSVEKHAMIYHSNMPKIHMVNLGVFLPNDVVDENRTNEIHLTENHLNLNCINTITSGADKRHNHNLKILAEAKEFSNLLGQVDDIEDVEVKIEQKKVDNDPHLTELATFICQPDLDIKQESESNRTEMLQWIDENTSNVKAPASDRLQIKLVTEMVDDGERIKRENKEPKNTNEEVEKLNDEINPPEQLEKAKKSVDVIEVGPISVIKEFNILMFQCNIENCSYSSEDKKTFAIHCEVIHKDFFNNFGIGKCNICSIQFDYEEKLFTVYDVYIHIETIHKDFFELESATNFKLMDGVWNVSRSEFPFIISNVTSLAEKSDTNSVGLPLPLVPLITEDKEEVLNSEVKLKQLISTSEDDSKCTPLLTDIPMTDTEKQNRKCPKAAAVMMKSPLLNALYKCPKYDCSFVTMFPLPFQRHLATHHSILMDTLVPCLYCDYKISYSSYLIHLEARHGHCLFGCGDCFYRTTNSYFVTMHHELMHPNTKFNILQLEVVTSNRISTDTIPANLSELVLPYNCREDGFLGCPFKTLYFDEYLKHMREIHQVDGLGSFLSENKLQKETVIKGWLAKEVGPFQCRYCKKATLTHQEMGRHQAVFHSQEQCLFYYRQFVPNNTVLIPEQVNVEDPSFINHVIHLPNQVHLCNFKLSDGLLYSTSAKLTSWQSEVSLPLLSPLSKDIEADLNQSTVSPNEPETFSVLVNDEECLLEKSDSLCLDEQPKGDGVQNDPTATACKLQCKWKGCYQTYDSQTALAKHIEKNHVHLQKGEEFTCFWIDCPRKSEPFALKRNLSRHMNVHSGEKPYKCSDCNKAFSQLGDLKIHQKNHTGERPYLCQFSNCFKSFISSSDRVKHQRTHRNSISYGCQVTGCSEKYTDPDCLQKHMENHTVDEQLKMKSVENKQKESDFVLEKSSNSSDGSIRTHCDTLQCKWEGCQQIYDSQAALVRHIEENHVHFQRDRKFIYYWINCPRKLKPYSSKQNLLIHMRVHSGAEPYKCPVQGCKKEFLTSWTLEVHQRSHTGEGPDLCQVSNYFNSLSTPCDTEASACQIANCSKTYADPSNFLKHTENSTVDEEHEVELNKLIKKEEKENDFIIYHL